MVICRGTTSAPVTETAVLHTSMAVILILFQYEEPPGIPAARSETFREPAPVVAARETLTWMRLVNLMVVWTSPGLSGTGLRVGAYMLTICCWVFDRVPTLADLRAVSRLLLLLLVDLGRPAPKARES
jgi:hypothetical protein